MGLHVRSCVHRGITFANGLLETLLLRVSIDWNCLCNSRLKIRPFTEILRDRSLSSGQWQPVARKNISSDKDSWFATTRVSYAVHPIYAFTT